MKILDNIRNSNNYTTLVKPLPTPTGLKGIEAMFGKCYSKMNPPTKSDSWYQANMGIAKLPDKYKMEIAWSAGKITKFAVHVKLVKEVEAIFQELWNFARIIATDKRGPDAAPDDLDLATNAELKKAGLSKFGGCYNFRATRNGTKLSTHSWGIAIDLDPIANYLGNTNPPMPMWVVDTFEEYGWVWGGRWKGKGCDGMHFQKARGY